MNVITTREFYLPMYDGEPCNYWINFYGSLPHNQLGVAKISIQSELALQGAVLEAGMLYFARDEDRTAFLLRWA